MITYFYPYMLFTSHPVTLCLCQSTSTCTCIPNLHNYTEYPVLAGTHVWAGFDESQKPFRGCIGMHPRRCPLFLFPPPDPVAMRCKCWAIVIISTEILVRRRRGWKEAAGRFPRAKTPGRNKLKETHPLVWPARSRPPRDDEARRSAWVVSNDDLSGATPLERPKNIFHPVGK